MFTTAAEVLGGWNEAVFKACRTVDIMADAAYAILCKDSKSFTGNYCIDDDVIRGEGITDLEQYSCVKGERTDFPFRSGNDFLCGRADKQKEKNK